MTIASAVSKLELFMSMMLHSSSDGQVYAMSAACKSFVKEAVAYAQSRGTNGKSVELGFPRRLRTIRRIIPPILSKRNTEKENHFFGAARVSAGDITMACLSTANFASAW